MRSVRTFRNNFANKATSGKKLTAVTCNPDTSGIPTSILGADGHLSVDTYATLNCYTGPSKSRNEELFCGNSPHEKELKYDTGSDDDFNRVLQYVDDYGKAVKMSVCGNLQSFSFNIHTPLYAVSHVIVKGGKNFTLYTYPSPVKADSDLKSPYNYENDKYYDISHFSFILVELSGYKVSFDLDNPCVPDDLTDLTLNLYKTAASDEVEKSLNLLTEVTEDVIYSSNTGDVKLTVTTASQELDGWHLLINGDEYQFNSEVVLARTATPQPIDVVVFYKSSYIQC